MTDSKYDCPFCGADRRNNDTGYGLAGGTIGVYEFCCEYDMLIMLSPDDEGATPEQIECSKAYVARLKELWSIAREARESSKPEDRYGS